MRDCKPCPFCGSTEIVPFDYPYKKPGLRGCYMMCANCGAQAGKTETVEQAAGYWNRRYKPGKHEAGRMAKRERVMQLLQATREGETLCLSHAQAQTIVGWVEELERKAIG